MCRRRRTGLTSPICRRDLSTSTDLTSLVFFSKHNYLQNLKSQISMHLTLLIFCFVSRANNVDNVRTERIFIDYYFYSNNYQVSCIRRKFPEWRSKRRKRETINPVNWMLNNFHFLNDYSVFGVLAKVGLLEFELFKSWSWEVPFWRHNLWRTSYTNLIKVTWVFI